MKKFSLFFLLLMLFAVGCERDQEEEIIDQKIEIPQSVGNMRMLTKNELPELSRMLTFDKHSTNLVLDIELPKEIKEVDLDNIMEVYNEESGDFIYSIRAIQKQKDSKKTYNFIVKKTSNGDWEDPQLILHQMTNQFKKDFYSGKKSFDQFDGKIKQISIKKKRGSSTRCNQDEICEEIEMNGGSNGGGSGGTPGPGPGGISSGTDCVVEYVSVPCTCAGHTAGQHCTCERDGGSDPYIYAKVTCTIPFETFCEFDCPPMTETIPVNFPDLDGDGTEEEFDHLSPAILECVGPFSVLLDQLNINNYNTLESMCSGDFSSSLPECEGCSNGQKQIVWAAHIKAREMLECASQKLSSYNGQSPSSVKQALDRNFGGADSELAGSFVNFLLKYIKVFSSGTGYTLQNNGDGYCGSNTYAWSFPAIHATNVRLCVPAYFDQNATDRAETMIHEWMHLYYVAGDWAYNWSSEYNNLNTIQQLTNADAFSSFVKELCQ